MNPDIVHALAAVGVTYALAILAVCRAVHDGQRPIHDIVRDAERRAAREVRR